jgi:hypothetical protein
LAPLMGRRLLGVAWGFGGVIALAAAGYYNTAFIGSVPMILCSWRLLLSASTALSPTWHLHGQELWSTPWRALLNALQRQTPRWRETDSNPRSPRSGQHFARPSRKPDDGKLAR